MTGGGQRYIVCGMRKCRSIGVWLTWPLLAFASLEAGDYYLDRRAGDDARSGKSADQAWITIEKVNALVLESGDRILLRRGDRWEGTVSPRGSGTPENPIRLSTFGEGPRPLVDGGSRPAVLLSDQGGWIIEGLEVTNRKDCGQDALKARAGPRKPRAAYLRIRDCVARGAGGSGIHVGEDEGGNFDDVSVEDCLAFENQGSGIFIQGSYFDRVRSLAIRRSTAYGNGGDGIKIYSGSDGVIEHCTAYRNGWKEDARVGIWCWNAEGVTIQFCESYGNRTPGTQDGGGFDIDWSCSGCVIQCCYAHDNEGAGFLFMGAGEAGITKGSTVRFNVSQNDGRRNGYGGIVCYGNLQDSLVHNNAVYLEGPAPGAALQFRGDQKARYPRGVRSFNNVLLAFKGREALSVPSEATAENRFNHDAYFSPDGLKLAWGGKTFADLESFSKATGEESHGLAADPRLRAPGRAGLGRLPLEAYRLLESSPCIRAGADFTPAPGTQDYWGMPLTARSAGVRWNIGPDQETAPAQARK